MDSKRGVLTIVAAVCAPRRVQGRRTSQRPRISALVCYNQRRSATGERFRPKPGKFGRFSLLSILSIKHRKRLDSVEMGETGEIVERVESPVNTRVSANPLQPIAGS